MCVVRSAQKTQFATSILGRYYYCCVIEDFVTFHRFSLYFASNGRFVGSVTTFLLSNNERCKVRYLFFSSKGHHLIASYSKRERNHE